MLVAVDLSALDTAKLSSPCGDTGPVLTCTLGEFEELPAGGSANLSMRMEHLSGTGPAGSITITVTADTTDPAPANNTFTAPVEIAGHGAAIRSVPVDQASVLKSAVPDGYADVDELR
jgi:hypothetical protein